MKRELEDELIGILIPYMSRDEIEEVKMKITMLLTDYHVDKEERSLIVYEENETDAAIRRFLGAKIARGCTKRTIRYYRLSITSAFRKIGKPYDRVTADDVRYYLAQRIYKDGVSKTTANNERRNLSAFYGWLQQEEILLKNPMLKVEKVKEKKVKKKAFTGLEVEKIRAACQTSREEVIVEVLLSTWVRVTELVNIKISDIKGNEITVIGKGEKERTAYLSPRALVKVEAYLSERKDGNPYLLPRAKYAGEIGRVSRRCGGRVEKMWYRCQELVHTDMHMDYSSLEGVVRKIGKKAGVEKVHPHRFRRTGATLALKRGMPLLKVSKLLGHESIATTQIYLDVSEEELMREHEKYVT